MRKLQRIKIHPGLAAVAVIIVIAMILFSGFGYLNNQPPDVTEARIAFYAKQRADRGTPGAKKVASSQTKRVAAGNIGSSSSAGYP
jgi:hypothetical protein